jgi:hypothetical protein
MTKPTPRKGEKKALSTRTSIFFGKFASDDFEASPTVEHVGIVRHNTFVMELSRPIEFSTNEHNGDHDFVPTTRPENLFLRIRLNFGSTR